MYLTMQNIRAPFIGASLVLLISSTNITGMESELKQRLLSSNQNDIQSVVEQKNIDDCGICWEEKEVIFIPCEEGKKHSKICSECLDGCKDLCPFCRRTLNIEKKQNIITDTLYRYSDHLWMGGGCVSLAFYVCILFTAFP